MEMNAQMYLKRAIDLLKSSLEHPASWYMDLYEKDPSLYSFETDDRYAYILFAIPEENWKNLILLVFDGAQVIADASGYLTGLDVLMQDEGFLDACSQESDWTYLERQIAAQMLQENGMEHAHGMAFLTGSTYVTRAYRHKNIFVQMLDMIHAYAMDDQTGNACYLHILSLDPDIPCYGPDALDHPYYYQYDRDEPVRRQNGAVMRHLGYEVLQLETEHPEENTDGTKIWFAIRMEEDHIEDLPAGKQALA